MKKLIAILSWLYIGYSIGKGVAEKENNGDKYDALNKRLESKK